MASDRFELPQGASQRFFPRRLFRHERDDVLRHFMALTSADRQSRFGASLSDDAVEQYVQRIDFSKDALFGVAGDKLSLIGVAHLARSDDHAELGLSVLGADRNRGVGRSLLKRGNIHARTWQVRALYMHCLAANVAVIRLAKEEGMTTVAESGEADAWLQLPPPEFATFFEDAVAEGVSSFDHWLKIQQVAWHAMLMPEGESLHEEG